MTHSPCNLILWNRQSSKTRSGMPCLGCTEPEFPCFDLAPGTLFKTQTVMGVPRDLPTGIDKKGYIALTGAAKNAAPAWAKQPCTNSAPPATSSPSAPSARPARA